MTQTIAAPRDVIAGEARPMSTYLESACSAYRDGFVCAHGFVQVANCRKPEVCKCGIAYAGKAPPCLIDEIPEHLAKDDGSPLFVRSQP